MPHSHRRAGQNQSSLRPQKTLLRHGGKEVRAQALLGSRSTISQEISGAGQCVRIIHVPHPCERAVSARVSVWECDHVSM